MSKQCLIECYNESKIELIDSFVLVLQLIITMIGNNYAFNFGKFDIRVTFVFS